MTRHMALHISLAVALLLACSLAQTPQAYAEQVSSTSTALTLQFVESSSGSENSAEQAAEHAEPSGRSLPKTGDELSRKFAPIGMFAAIATATVLLSAHRRRGDDNDVL